MRPIAVLILGSAAIFGTLSACGGESTSNESSQDTGGTSGSGGTASGGTASGGTASGGTSGSGATTANPDCLLPIDSGPCAAAARRYAFNARNGVCEQFVYGGCDGNANNFGTVADCQVACLGDEVLDITRCTTDAECTVSTPGCCGGCEPLPFHALVAINAAHREVLRARTCDPGTVCGACPDYSGAPQRPWFGARCEAGHCVAYDARIAARCTTFADCHLRAGISCCEDCSPANDELVAISSEATLLAVACGDGAACDACVPTFSPAATAYCTDEGLCGVAFTGP